MKPFLRKALDTFILSALITIAAALVYVAYLWSADNIVRPSTVDILTKSEVVRIGEPFQFDTLITRTRECRILVDRTYTNLKTKEVYVTAPSERQGEIVTNQLMHVTLELPKSIVPGPYLFQYTFSYYCNISNDLFGPIVYRPESIYLEVIE